MFNIYCKIEGKLALIQVKADDHAEAIEAVKQEYKTTGAVLTLIKA